MPAGRPTEQTLQTNNLAENKAVSYKNPVNAQYLGTSKLLLYSQDFRVQMNFSSPKHAFLGIFLAITKKPTANTKR